MSYKFDDNIPIYVQLKEILINRIQEGEYKPGDYLPSEKEIINTFNISRTPIRKAMSELERDGYIEKRMGKGMLLVSSKKVIQNIPKLTSFSEDMKSKGLKPDYKLINLSKVKKPDDLKERLSKEDFRSLHMNCLRVDRLLLADYNPMAIHFSYLFNKEFEKQPRKFRRAIKKGVSLYKLIKSYNINLTKATQYISAETANPYEAKYLEINKGSPLVSMHRLTYSETNRLIEYVKGYYRADQYEYVIEMG